jgi:hypothetical protein
VSPESREKLDQADTSPNASHTIRLSSPGNGDWDWKLQISNVSIPDISNSTPYAHVASTTWHFSRTHEEQVSYKRAKTRQSARTSTSYTTCLLNGTHNLPAVILRSEPAVRVPSAPHAIRTTATPTMLPLCGPTRAVTRRLSKLLRSGLESCF